MTRAKGYDILQIPAEAHFISRGQGRAVVLIHGLAASLHDWDAVVPRLLEAGYATYALDLLGHGNSPKPEVPSYEMAWMAEHFVTWLERLALEAPPVLIAHSLGGYLALEYARQFPARVLGLVLVDPFYSHAQLPILLRRAYAHPALTSLFLRRTPGWAVRGAIDVWSIAMGHRRDGLHALSAAVRAQTAEDYLRTAPAAYGVLRRSIDLTPYLASIDVPSLVIWGERDQTLTPNSFTQLVRRMPRAIGRSSATGHVPHQAKAEWFSDQVIGFLASLEAEEAGKRPVPGSVQTPDKV